MDSSGGPRCRYEDGRLIAQKSGWEEAYQQSPKDIGRACRLRWCFAVDLGNTGVEGMAHKAWKSSLA